jgi:hypothetical protein
MSMKIKFLLVLVGLVILSGCATTTTVSTGVVYTDPFPHTIIYYDEWRGYQYYWDRYPYPYHPPLRPYHRPITPHPRPPHR